MSKKRHIISNAEKSRTSPKSSKRGCLCKDNTYHVDCCDGSLMAQGVGKSQA
jgi:hypothetical protein